MTQTYGIARPRRAVCGVCGEPTDRPTRMCGDCIDSYEAHAQQDGSIAEVIAWAARRARWYAQRRGAQGRKRVLRDGAAVVLTLAELEHLRDFAHNVDDPEHDAWWEQLDKKLTAALSAARAKPAE